MEGNWKRADNVIWEEFGNDALLVAPSGTKWSLNSLAAAIWKYCDGSRGSGELAAGLARARGQGLTRAQAEIAAFCESLAQIGLLQAVPCTAAGAPSELTCFKASFNMPPVFGQVGAGRRSQGRPSPRGVSGPV